MSEKYFSILICDHGDRGAFVYANGLVLGTIKEGVFTPDKLMTQRLPFPEKSMEELIAFFDRINVALAEAV